jgi:hypothetical protein
MTTTGPNRRSSAGGGPLRRYAGAPAVVTDEAVAGAAELQQHGRYEQHADEDAGCDQLAHAQDRNALGGQQDQQHGRVRRGQARVRLNALLGPAFRPGLRLGRLGSLLTLTAGRYEANVTPA